MNNLRTEVEKMKQVVLKLLILSTNWNARNRGTQIKFRERSNL